MEKILYAGKIFWYQKLLVEETNIYRCKKKGFRI
jgi:hypothetical protein